MGILNLPFSFKDNAHLRKVLDGEIGNKLADLVTPTAPSVWPLGQRFPPHHKLQATDQQPEGRGGAQDPRAGRRSLSGYLQRLGAIPTVISFGELYSALQLKTVDGQRTLRAHHTRSFMSAEVRGADRHIHSVPVLINKAKFDSLPADLQKIQRDSAREYAIKQPPTWRSWKPAVEGCRGQRHEITDPDKAPFAAPSSRSTKRPATSSDPRSSTPFSLSNNRVPFYPSGRLREYEGAVSSEVRYESHGQNEWIFQDAVHDPPDPHTVLVIFQSLRMFFKFSVAQVEEIARLLHDLGGVIGAAIGIQTKSHVAVEIIRICSHIDTKRWPSCSVSGDGPFFPHPRGFRCELSFQAMTQTSPSMPF
jgi:hypothetical protein